MRRPEGVERGVKHFRTKAEAVKKGNELLRKGWRVELRRVGRGTGAWMEGWRWMVLWYTSYDKRR